VSASEAAARAVRAARAREVRPERERAVARLRGQPEQGRQRRGPLAWFRAVASAAVG